MTSAENNELKVLKHPTRFADGSLKPSAIFRRPRETARASPAGPAIPVARLNPPELPNARLTLCNQALAETLLAPDGSSSFRAAQLP